MMASMFQGVVLTFAAFGVATGSLADVPSDRTVSLLDATAAPMIPPAERVRAGEPMVIAKRKGERYGLEGRLIEYDEASSVVKVRVVKTKVSGGAGTGAVAGKPSPKEIRRGQTIDFAVVPTGSVLRRTVIKNRDGSGLDTTGTKEGFQKAIAMVPRDRNVIFSFEKVPDPKAGQPEWSLRIIQLRMTEEEAQKRLDELEKAAEANDSKD